MTSSLNYFIYRFMAIRNMADRSETQKIVSFVKALGTESRLKILLLFVDGRERTVNEITEAIGIGQSTCSEHLSLMKRAGLMTSYKQGKEVYYLPDKRHIVENLERINLLLKSCC